MGQKQWLVVLIVLVAIALIITGWRLWTRTTEEPVIKFTPEQAKQAELERQRLQQGGGPQPLPSGETLPLPPKGGRRR
jgi:beta-lactam-binding protein with PASTA domain